MWGFGCGGHSCSWSKWQLPEQRDRYQWAITPHSDYMAHTYHLQGEHSSCSKEIPRISSVEANLRDEGWTPPERKYRRRESKHKNMQITNMLVQAKCMLTWSFEVFCGYIANLSRCHMYWTRLAGSDLSRYIDPVAKLVNRTFLGPKFLFALSHPMIL